MILRDVYNDTYETSIKISTDMIIFYKPRSNSYQVDLILNSKYQVNSIFHPKYTGPKDTRGQNNVRGIAHDVK